METLNIAVNALQSRNKIKTVQEAARLPLKKDSAARMEAFILELGNL